jgi:AhpD family alkylhydroperoxidase
VATLRRAAGAEFESFVACNDAVAPEDGSVARKYRDLISVAVARTTQCVYCIETHVRCGEGRGRHG